MTLELKHDGFKKDVLSVKKSMNDVQYIFKFDNNYGASVIKNLGSYGHERDLWELAVIWFSDEYEWHLCYDTEITNDVIGHLTDEAVCTWLERIKNLKEC